MTDRLCYLYHVYHRESGTLYIGRAVDVVQRWKNHINKAKSGSRYHFHNALRKYGQSAFDWIVVGTLSSYGEAGIHEVMEIQKYRSQGIRLYNMTDGGEGCINLSPESKARHAAAVKLALSAPDTRDRLSRQSKERWSNNYESMYLATQSPEVKYKRGLAIKEAYKCPDLRERMRVQATAILSCPELRSKISTAVRLAKGTPEARKITSEQVSLRMNTPEAKRLIGQQSAARWADLEQHEKQRLAIECTRKTPESRRKTSVVTKTLWQDPEYAEKQSSARKQHRGTPEARARQSEISKAAWADPEMRAKRAANRAAKKLSNA